ncbi:hypothetical protein B0T22DRAFT_497670 [Podospora appendiculata]|uniref:NAD(P)-binding protein n=1 Tax=Podospora appendiculata TaxID=314037 RepID=A0AAE1CIQ8_9PEZI|nr:hypothetical protein B0T22DRAFT_497670 [Podospora appendiculata]
MPSKSDLNPPRVPHPPNTQIQQNDLASIWTQFFPPRNGAPITEANLASQAGKVFIVTGASSGLGYELTRILYGAGATVYMLTWSRAHAHAAMDRIAAFYADRPADHCHAPGGCLEFIPMDLTDLASVRAAANAFLARVSGRLDVLFNNAGIAATANPPATAQGTEYHFTANSLGAVRVVWPASVLVEMMTPPGGIRASFLQDPNTVITDMDANELYSASKAANWFSASEFARRTGRATGVLHIAGNPGNYLTNIWRDTSSWLFWLLWSILRNPVHGAETYLFMGLSPAVTADDAAAGRYVVPDGRWYPGGMREDLLLALRSVDEGGSGRAAAYFDWCEERVKGFL